MAGMALYGAQSLGADKDEMLKLPRCSQTEKPNSTKTWQKDTAPNFVCTLYALFLKTCVRSACPRMLKLKLMER